MGYQRWALLPVDPDPRHGEARALHPPVLTVLALDPGSSLVFRFAAPAGTVQVVVEVTALCAAGRRPDLFTVYSSDSGTLYEEVAHGPWQTTEDGPYVQLTSRLEGVSTFAKLVLTGPPPVVVSRVT
ncbi:MAG: hypothetical protein AB1505_24395, partial [Candidatus Latescibacterota bacterium]